MSFPVSLEVLALFCLTELAFSASPGPAVFLVVSRAMRDGASSAVAAVLGVLIGNLIYFALSATAVGAILFALREWFFVAQWGGAAYLLWLAAKMFLGAGDSDSDSPHTPSRVRGAFRESLILTLANPKVIVFFIAFLPLFLNPEKPAAPQILVLAAASFLVELLVLTVYAAAARKSALMLGKKFEKHLARGGAILLCAAAVSLLLISD